MKGKYCSVITILLLFSFLRLQAQEYIYMESASGAPWGQSSNITNMNEVFGEGNWQDLDFETADFESLMSGNISYIFMDGSGNGANELEDFLNTNIDALENWVQSGGVLFINCGPNEGNGMSLGFGGVSLVNGANTSNVVATNETHPIFEGPFLPMANAWSGSSFAHADIIGPDLTSLLVDNNDSNKIILATKEWGAGHVFFGGMTMTDFHNSEAESNNLRKNILSIRGAKSNNDAGISKIEGPVNFCPGSHDVVARLTNFGKNQLSNVTIDWEFNGVAQSPVSWTTPLDSVGGEGDNFASVVLGTKSFIAGESYTIKAWTSNPNGVQDTIPGNDTTYVEVSLSLSGAFTVGGTSPDFEDVQEAVGIIVSKGVCGPVTFNIRDGVYSGQIVVSEIEGASAVNTITFQSESRDSTAVTINYETDGGGPIPSLSNVDIGYDNNYVIQLDGADYITFQDLTFQATDDYFETVVEFRNGATHNRFINNSIKSGSLSDKFNWEAGALIRSNYSGENDELNLIQSNIFYGGSYGLYFQGADNDDPELENRLLDNHFIYQNKYGVYLRYQNAVEVSGNVISNSNENYETGIYLDDSYGATRVLANRLSLVNPDTGIEIYGNYANAPDYALIANNFIAIASYERNSIGIQTRYSDSQRFYHNNVNITGEGFGSTGFEINGGFDNRLINNVLVNTAGGIAIFIEGGGEVSTDIVSDYNNLYTGQPLLGYYHNEDVTSLEEWQEVSAMDSSSVSFDPAYFSDTDLHVKKGILDGTGLPLTEVTEDIDGQTRSSTTPDIGADEFEATGVDATLLAINYPEAPFAAGSHPVSAEVRNSGAETISSLTIDWKVNGSDKSSVNWSGSLSKGQSTTIALGNYNFENVKSHRIAVQLSAPNGESDLDPADDSLAVENIYAALPAGTYTLGGASPDFSSFTEAANALTNGGILGSVDIEVATGTYNEQVSFGSVSGASSASGVTFTGDTTVVLTYADADYNNNYTLRLLGADYFTFDGLKITATNSNYGVVINISEGASNNKFLNNEIVGVSTTSTYNRLAVIFSENQSENGVNDHNNAFISNTIENGSYGMYWRGDFNNEEGTEVKDNTFVNQYRAGIYLDHQLAPLVLGNVITTTTSYSNYEGIYARYAYDSLEIAGNDIQIASGGRGIRIYQSSGTPDGNVYNNFISIGGSNYAYGIELDNSDNQKVYHNNVLITSTDVNGGRALQADNGSNLELLNNVLVNTGGGYAIYIQDNNIVSQSDYNVLYTTGDNTGYHSGSNYNSIEDWKAATSFDEHSLSIDPLFVSNTDLHVNKGLLDGAAMPLDEVTTDIDGEARDTENPDIGADEFTPTGNDASLLSAELSNTRIGEGVNPVRIVVRNSGGGTLTSFDVNWEVNGSAQTYNWAGSLATGEQDTVSLGTFDFQLYTAYNITATVVNPNGIADIDTQDNAVSVENFYVSLGGTYTIGGETPDFATFSDAVDALNLSGVWDSVVFNVRSGTYTEQVELSEVAGTASDYTVTFQSESGDSTSVVLQYNSGSSNNYVVRLNGADYITFKDLTLKSQNTSYGHVIELTNGATHNKFLNNVLQGVNTTSSSNYRAVVFVQASNNEKPDAYNTWDNNRILNGSYGLHLRGYYNYPSSGNTISNNIFEEQYYYGVFAEEQAQLTIDGNKISTSSNQGNYRAIHLEDCRDNSLITRNNINAENGGYGIAMFYCDATAGNETLVANNFVYQSGNGNAYGIYLYSSDYLNLVHNTVKVDNTNEYNNYSFYSISSSDQVYLNNIFTNYGGGYAVRIDNGAGIISSDFNNYFSTGSRFGYYEGAEYGNLSEWKSVTEKDENSLAVDPGFKALDNLHVREISLYNAGFDTGLVTLDIDGDLRDNNPDIGADEFTPAENDAGVVAFESPIMPFTPTSQNVSVAIRNNGLNALTSVDVGLQINDSIFNAVSWTGSLATGETEVVELSTFDFESATAYNLKTWTANPNAGTDADVENDSTVLYDIYTGLAGSYTIGGDTPDFNTFQEAAMALEQGGVTGAVTFEVRDGDYNEQVSISEINGASDVNTVTFRAESGDSTAVELSYLNTSSSNNYVLQLDGADHMTFENLTISALNSSYGRAVVLKNKATHNVFRNNLISGVNVTSTYDRLATIYVNSEENNRPNDFNTFTNNVVRNGSYGFMLFAFNSNEVNRVKGLVLSGNKVLDQHYTAIYLDDYDYPVITDNEVQSGSSYNNKRGIYITSCNGALQILRNKIVLDNAEYGIYLNGNDSEAGSEGLIANNFVSFTSSNYAYGIYQYYGSYQDFIHNTVNIINGEPEFTYAFYSQNGSEIRLLNNVLANNAGGYAIYTNGTGISTSNHNNLFTAGDALGYWSGTVSDLVAWQASSSMDAQSISINPRFVSDTNLHVREVTLNEGGTYDSRVSEDIDGEARDINTPDIGADEFTPASVDAGILALESPTVPFALGEQQVQVTLRNFGLDTLNNVEVHWSVNDSMQTTFNWTGQLTSGSAESVGIGNYTFDPGVKYTLKTWTALPNGISDIEASNDTTTVDSLYTALDGTYTLGGSNPDFDDFGAAVSALKNGGVVGAVVFEVRAGSYTEQITIPEIDGMSTENNVVFQSADGDSTSVSLSFSSTNDDNYTVLLDGADHFTFRGITIAAEDANYGCALELRNGATNNTFENIFFKGVQATSTSTNQAVINSFSHELNDHDNNFTNNRIVDGSYGIHFEGHGDDNETQNGLEIANNRFENQYYSAINLRYHQAPNMSGNVISTDSDYSSYIGIYANNCEGGITVTGNKIYGSKGRYGIYFYYTDGTSGNRSLIANNFIQVGGTGNANGIHLNRSDYTNVFHNNINVTSTSTSAYNAALYIYRGSYSEVKNNVLVNSGAGYAINTNSAGYSSDYNNLFTLGEYLGYYNNNNRATLSDWQNTSNRDDNSVSVDPYFQSEIDLHVYNSELDGAGVSVPEVTHDIDGEIRNVSRDIGADEFIPPTEDASVASITSPVHPMRAGFNEVSVSLLNNASANLNSVSIFWTVNGEYQPTYNWTGELASGVSDSVKLGDFEFVAGTDYNITAWTYQPNGLTDKVVSNDTASVENLYVGMSGEYTIGGVDADFPNFTQAVSALNDRGVNGTITFVVADGIYNEQIAIGQVEGVSEDSPVTFRSLSGDSTAVSLTYSPGSSNNYTLLLDGADYFTFQDMTLATSGGTYGRVLAISNGANHNAFDNVIFKGSTNTSSYYEERRALVYSSNGVDEYNTFRNSIFRDGAFAFYYYGEDSNDQEKGTVIENNLMEDQVFAGVRLIYQKEPIIKHNEIVTYTSATFQGIYGEYLDDDFEISNNKISVDQDGNGVYLRYCDGRYNERARVYNNFIAIGDDSQSYGLYLNNSDYIDVNYNSVNLRSTNTQGRALYVAGGSSLASRNNILVNSGGGYAFYTSSTSAFTTSDYNDLYTSGANLAYWGTDLASLETLQSASGQEANSLSIDPSFSSDSDLHVGQANLDGAGTPIDYILEDIDGQLRNNLSPDIGADEFGAGLTTNDIGVVAMIGPGSACELDSLEDISVRVQNYGIDTVSNFAISYVLNDSIFVTDSVSNWQLVGGKNREYTFNDPVDMREHGSYQFQFFTKLTNDSDSLNDSLRNVTIEHYPAVIAEASGDTTVCSNEYITIRAEGGSDYEWSNVNSNNVLWRRSYYSVSPNSTTTYKVKVINTYGCFDYDTLTVNSLPAPVAPSIEIFGSTSACSDDTIRLESSIDKNILWSTGEVTKSIFVYEPGTYSVVHQDTITGCSARGSVTLSHAAQPYIYTPKRNICAGSSATLTVRNGSVFNWSTGETTRSITVSPAQDSTYSVQIINSDGCEYERSITITIKPSQPTPEITSISNDTEVCQGESTTLTVAGNAEIYQWSNGYYGSTINVSPSSKTTYTVTATNGDCSVGSASASVTVDVLPLPEAPIIVATGSSSLSFCDADSITLTASDVPGSILWSTGDTTQSIVTVDPGTYSLSHVNEQGCKAIASVTLTDPPLPYITGKFEVCEGESTALTVNNGSTYVWSTGDSTRTITVAPDTTTTYYVDISNEEGCDYTDSVEVTILPVPKITSISGDTTVCSGTEVPLAVAGVADQFIWSDGQEGTDISVVPTERTVYRVTATNGCTLSNFKDVSEVKITVLPLPEKPVITPSDTIVICKEELVTLTSNVSDSIVWSTGDSTASIEVSQAGIYSVSHFNQYQCTNSDQVVVKYVEEPELITSGYNTICRGDSLTISVLHADELVWSTGDSTATIKVSPQDTTTYYVTGNNNLGCIYSDSITVNILAPVPPDSVTNMLPVTSETPLSLPLSLSWAPSDNASHYDIYVWKDSTEKPVTPTVLDVDQISHLFEESLDYGELYNWQVHSKNSCHETPGPVQQFTLRELPDLVVTDVDVPKSAFSGQNIEVTWEVTNNGLGNTQVKERWVDAIYISADDTFNSSTDKYLGGVPNLTALNTGQSYEKSANFTLPNGITGEFYIFVFTDAYKAVVESAEDNNKEKNSPSMLVQLTPPPDLRVTQIIRPNNVFSGQAIDVSWTVTNKGSGETEGGSWEDIIYLSPDSVLRTSSAVKLTTAKHTGLLEPGEKYSDTRTVTIPQAVFGNYFIYVVTDHKKQIFEHAFDNNNTTRSEGFEVILAPPPDLVVTDIVAVDSASNREYVDISWTVQNQGGSPTPVNRWKDRIYISDSVVFDSETAKELSTASISSSLNLGETYTKATRVQIPNKISGPHYIFIRTDVDDNVFEYENEANNLKIDDQPIEVLSPDIIVSKVVTADTASSGKPVDVSWVVKNVGPGTLYRQYWTDRISSSGSAIFNEGVTEIGNDSYNGGIMQPGDSIARYTTVTLPEGVSGKNFIHIEADYENQVYEKPSDADNKAYTDHYVKLSPWPDLKVTEISTPSDTVTAGDNMPFNFTVTNDGSAATSNSYWVDKVFISTEPEVTEDTVFLKQFARTSALLRDSSYSIGTKLLLDPYLEEGEYYLHLFVDYDTVVYEHTDEENNIVNYGPLFIKEYPAVDLTVTNISTYDSLYSGREESIQWQVSNIGEGATLAGYWYDALYLSKDSIWNGNQDTYLTEWPVYGPIAAGEGYEDTQTFKVPDGLSGDYYLIVVSDHSEEDEDSAFTIDQNRDNNYKAHPIGIKLTPSADLTITDWEAPNNGVAGQPITVEWSVTNEGDGPTLTNTWTDKLFLSTDLKIDKDDHVLESIIKRDTLLPGETYQDSVEVYIPTKAEGNYILLFKTDNNDTEYEHQGEDNNEKSSLITITRPLPADLIVQQVVVPDSVRAGDKVNIEWTVENKGTNPAIGVMEDVVYFSKDQTWDISDIVLGTLKKDSYLPPLATETRSLEARLNNATLGDYYVIVKADAKNNIIENNDDNNEKTSSQSVNVSIDELPMYVTKRDTLLNQVNRYYRIEIPDSLKNETLLVSLKGGFEGANNEMYIKYGESPTRNDYDESFDNPFAPDQEVIISYLNPGTYYLLVRGDASHSPTQPIALEAGIMNFEIREVNANVGGNTGPLTVAIEGAKFTEESTFYLEQGSTKIEAGAIEFVDPTKVFATFNLTDADLGYYSVIAKDTTGQLSILFNAFEVETGTGYVLETNYDYPASTRPGRIVAITLQFANGGNVDIPMPTRAFISKFKAPIAHSVGELQYDYHSLYLEFKEPGGPTSVLRPGAISSITVYTKAVRRLSFKVIK